MAFELVIMEKTKIAGISLFIALLGLAREVTAQYNDSTFYFINYTTTGLVNRTNQGSSYTLNNSLRTGIDKKNISFYNANTWIYGKQFNVLSNNDFSSATDFNVQAFFPHFYYWGLGTFDKSYSLKINHRFQTGAGIGYHLLTTKVLVINISDGILYEKGNLAIADLLGRTEYETFRNSFRLKFRLSFHEKVVLEGNNFWQPSLSYKEDYIIKSSTTLSVRLQKWLSFSSSLIYNQFNLSGRENLLLNFGLTFEKYF